MKIGGSYVLLSGDEVARAIDAYLKAHGIDVVGPRTVRVYADDHGAPVGSHVYVDPSGRICDNR